MAEISGVAISQIRIVQPSFFAKTSGILELTFVGLFQPSKYALTSQLSFLALQQLPKRRHRVNRNRFFRHKQG
jgi:hypothetical protein